MAAMNEVLLIQKAGKVAVIDIGEGIASIHQTGITSLEINIVLHGERLLSDVVEIADYIHRRFRTVVKERRMQQVALFNACPYFNISKDEFLLAFLEFDVQGHSVAVFQAF